MIYRVCKINVNLLRKMGHKMKVTTDNRILDSKGRNPIVFEDCTIEEINEYLHSWFEGSKLAIVFDEMEDKQDMKEVNVYFLNEILQETAEYSNKVVKDGITTNKDFLCSLSPERFTDVIKNLFPVLDLLNCYQSFEKWLSKEYHD